MLKWGIITLLNYIEFFAIRRFVINTYAASRMECLIKTEPIGTLLGEFGILVFVSVVALIALFSAKGALGLIKVSNKTLIFLLGLAISLGSIYSASLWIKHIAFDIT